MTNPPQRTVRPAAVAVAALAAVLVAFGTMVAVLQIGTSGAPETEPVLVGAEAPSEQAERLCPGLMALVPEQLDGQPRREVESPSPYVAAWGDPPVTVRCGAPEPVDLTQTSTLVTVDGVAWFRQDGEAGVRWSAVGREIYVDTTVPADNESQESILVPLSRIVAASIPATS